ncbi:MAG: type I DNA topoisomerase [Spirochaetales bacterium]|jgi:DNA topoisomerase I|nr:type I DNA topoisomerase [Spirochaetales bacterium]
MAKKKKKKKETLLIVESPAKARTIERYLGAGYTVAASMGHLIDLPKSRVAVDVENDFEPEYITVRGKAKILKDLQTKAKKATTVLLASDNDREGEAISYHLRNALLKKNEGLKIERIVFNEITPQAIREAVKNPRGVDTHLVNAQKARRVLDRLVGYNLSPILWKKVKNGLSAGRVQSVALRLICDREREVEAFIPEEYWTLDVSLQKGKTVFQAQLFQYAGEKPAFKKRDDVEEVTRGLSGKTCSVSKIKDIDKTLKPRAPFTTSTLQQTAANRLGFTSRKTMQIAQQLYEGINMGTNRVGLITYMRTDSTRLSKQSLDEVRDYLQKNFPGQLPEKPNVYSSSKNAQDAHEAVRPTYPTYSPDYVKEHLTRDQLKLYSIIWERFVSCQMINAVTRTTTIEFAVGDCLFRTSTTKVVEPGFQKVLKTLKSKEKRTKLPVLKENEAVDIVEYLPEQHFTSGPARFTDASIVKMLEEKGIGRPSTYAPIISRLLDRYYVVRKNRQLMATTLGLLTNDMLVSTFPDLLEVNFTAGMEERLDLVEENKQEWHEMVGDFYGPFSKQVEHVMETLESIKGIMDEETDQVCEKCGRVMMKKLGRFGFFLACSGFPECMSTKSLPLADCPKTDCGGEIVARRKQGGGKEFYGCTNYPECDFISYFKPINVDCPKCGHFMVEKYDKKWGSYKACVNPECSYLHTEENETSA